MPAPPKFDWPRSYLLDIYAKAVEHGFFLIGPLTTEQAESLRLALYRLRRRSDKANAAFIRPEYHLVTVGHYRPETSELPIIYNAVPDRDLPSFRIPDVGEIAPTLPTPQPQVPHSPVTPSPVAGPPAIEERSPEELNAYLLELLGNTIDEDKETNNAD